MNRNIDTLFIDLDGTLWDESIIIEKLKSKNKKIDKLISKVAAGLKKKNGFYTWIEVYQYFGFDYVKFLSDNSSYIIPYEGVANTLKLLKDNFTLWLTTDGANIYTKVKLQKLGLSNFFHGIITSDLLKTMKDSNIWWKKAVHLSGKSKKNIVVIGDSINDIVPPLSIGLKTIYIGNADTINKIYPEIQGNFKSCNKFNSVPHILNSL